MDIQQPRLSVGVISGGSVGTAVAERLAQAGHHIHGVVARSEASQKRVAERLPNTQIVSLEEAAQAALVIIAVPDTVLPEVIDQVAAVTRDGQMVAHTSGAHGCEILQPITDTGALPMAMHPAMTFSGKAVDAGNLMGCAWGVTADSETGDMVADLLVSSMGGVSVHVPEDKRPAYHAAISYAANYVVTLLSNAQRMLDHVLADDAGEGPPLHNPNSATLLRTIVPVAVEKALDQRMNGLTGPVARDDAPAVMRHIEALQKLEEGTVADFTGAYIPMAERTAQMLHSLEVERVLAELDMRLR